LKNFSALIKINDRDKKIKSVGKLRRTKSFGW